MRSRAEIAVAAAWAFTSGCGFGDGDPWGRVELGLTIELAPDASRLDGARLKTSNDFRIALDELRLEVAEVALTSEGGAGAAFDPAAPPAGYSLCHNGHCHSDDGRLVAYEDIAAELGGGTGATTVVVAIGAGASLVLGDARDVTLACSNGCDVSAPGVIDRARVTVASWRARGTVFDALTGEAARLPAEGLPFEIGGATPFVWTVTELHLAFGPGEELERALGLDVEVPAALFDGVAWGAMSADEAAAVIAEALAGTRAHGPGKDVEDEHGGEGEPLGAEACEHLEIGPAQAVTAGVDATSAVDTSEEHTRYDVTLVTVGEQPGGFVAMAIADAGEHVVFLDRDVALTITDAAGRPIEAARAVGDPSCDRVAVAYTVDFDVGTYTLTIAAASPSTASVALVLVPAAHDAH
ncbi:MAG: hypothetical protein IT385_07145 [Deltaproteobacteria bacterium]|nr:hypothetical protein [Deltaproteobacteria bacterium]